MILTAADACNEARVRLGDGAKKFWTDAELLDYLNTARDALSLALPRIYETTETITLAEGARQTLPNGSKRLFGLIENMTAESRRIITPINRETLSRVRPAWRSEDASDEILHFSYVETEPTVYEVFPPAMAGTQVRMSYSRPPSKLLMDGGSLPATALAAESEMARALQEYIVGLAYAKQSDTSPDAGQRSQAAFAMFSQFIQAEEVGKRDSSPNTLAIAGKPTEATNR